MKLAGSRIGPIAVAAMIVLVWQLRAQTQEEKPAVEEPAIAEATDVPQPPNPAVPEADEVVEQAVAEQVAEEAAEQAADSNEAQSAQQKEPIRSPSDIDPKSSVEGDSGEISADEREDADETANAEHACVKIDPCAVPCDSRRAQRSCLAKIRSLRGKLRRCR